MIPCLCATDGFNPPLMHGWVNMGLEAGLEVKLQAFQTYGIPSFYGGLPSGEYDDEGII
jgi:hypothetical protein